MDSIYFSENTQERSRRVELRREAERKRKEKEELAKKNRREEAEANARQKVLHPWMLPNNGQLPDPNIHSRAMP